MQQVWASGRADTVLRWMEWFEHQKLIGRYPAVAVHGALIFALLGRPARAERWAAAAERASPQAGCPMAAPWRATWPTCARSCAATASRRCAVTHRSPGTGLPAEPVSVDHAAYRGLSYLLEGEPGRADPIFARAFDAATDAPPLAAVVLAERCIVAAGRDDWPTAVTLRAGAVDGAGRSSTPTGPAPWSTPGPHGPPSIAATSPRPASTSSGPPGCGRCSPTPSGGVGPGPAGAGARLPRAHRPRWCADRPQAGVRHPPAAAGPWRAAGGGRGATSQGRDDRKARRWRLVPHHRRVAGPAAAGHPPHLPGDRRAPLCISVHGEVPSLSVYRKFGVSSRSAAIERAHRVGVLGHGSSSVASECAVRADHDHDDWNRSARPHAGRLGRAGWHVLPCAGGSTHPAERDDHVRQRPGHAQAHVEDGAGLSVAGTTTARPSQRPQRRYASRSKVAHHGPTDADRTGCVSPSYCRDAWCGSSRGVRRRPCLGRAGPEPKAAPGPAGTSIRATTPMFQTEGRLRLSSVRRHRER